MSCALAKLLNEPEQVIKKAIRILEGKNGYPSHDVRHLADNIQRVRSKISELNLDPDDTTSEELYHALLVKFQKDNRVFAAQYGAFANDYDKKIDLVVELIADKIKLPEVWTLKSHTAKQLVKNQPPKKIMKILGYRSVESLIKRQNIAELLLMSEYIESSAWCRAYQKKINSLDSSQFERQPIKLVSLSLAKWGEAENDKLVVFNANVGALGLLPTRSLANAELLTMVVLLLDGLSAFNGKADLSVFGPVINWWCTMDSLIANLNGDGVSMNICDVATNHLLVSDFGEHSMTAARRSFWKGLTSRYENLLTAEEDLKMSFERPVTSSNMPTNQPAFEYVEDV
jgi:hypothetical protein